MDAGIQKTVDVSGSDESWQRLVLSYDYGASSTTGVSTITRSRLVILDAD